VHTLNLKSQKEWREYCKSGKKPNDIPNYPDSHYKDKGWVSWGDWFGTYTIADQNKKFRPFNEAREFARSLNLPRVKEWEEYSKSGKKPNDIPRNPNKHYKDKGWVSWGDWLGTYTIAVFKRKFRPFNEAREFARSLHLSGKDDWYKYYKNNKLPSDIPTNPSKSYQDKGWVSWGDWFGTNTIAVQNRKFHPFNEAREFARSLNLPGVREWEEYSKSGRKPNDIPRHPERSYKDKGWISWGDWLGTNTIADQNRIFRPFNEAREFARSLNLSGQNKWRKYGKSGKKPNDIPNYPDSHYKDKGWVSWGDWLGTNTIASFNRASFNRKVRPFNEAREFARSLNLPGGSEWEQYCKSGKKPNDIPWHPERSYKNQGWISWGDWLGTGTLPSQETGWSIEKVKELLRSMIESRVIYNWDEARLYKFLLTKGVLNLPITNKHNNFFKNLVNAVRTDQGRKSIEDYAFSQGNDTPDLSSISHNTDDEIQAASTEELSKLVNENFDPLDYKEPPTVEQVLSSSSLLESINVDEEAIQFFLRGSINDLWKRAFKEKEETVIEVKNKSKNGHKFHDTVIEIFLTEYENTQKLKNPKDYSSKLKPNLMQKYVAYKISSSPYFGNFSGTGAGKTLSAILASRIINSKMTVIVCPNDIVLQWENEIKRAFSNSHTSTGKNAFSIQRDENKYQYIILNYDKFNQYDSSDLILKLVQQKIDFVILDEIHYSKITSEKEASLRNRNLVGLLTGIRKKNLNAKVLGLTATPIVNNLTEGKSLLEMITGKIYDDIKTNATVPNAVTLYEKLSTISIRHIPSYTDLYDKPEFVEVDADLDIESYNKMDLKDILSTEKILTNYRVKEILNHIDKAGYTIIYTEYVGKGIIQSLAKAIHQNLGLKVAFHTGDDHTGNKLFQEKKAQVLIASRPLSIGIDGLQKVCNRLIINSLPWTNARYQQLIGRLIRTDQVFDKVNVIIVLASLKFGNKKYEYDRKKWNRIEYKRTLADCAVDGKLPERNLVTPEQAHKEAIRWLERLERDEFSTVSRRDLEIELTPAEKRLLTRKYGDITLQHQKMNTEYSYTTHERMKKDPQEWIQYHRQLNEKRKSWSVDPLEVFITKLKTMSQRLKIGDFGCGTAKIMEEIGFERVISFDHIAINDKVIVCDMRSVSQYVDDKSLDVVIFSLSLMGKNWRDYIIEAKRCLSTRGSLFIAVTTKELDEGRRLHSLPNILKDNGFFIDTMEERGDFTFMEGIKI
jgi:superfamily II DNA or RNA helicase